MSKAWLVVIGLTCAAACSGPDLATVKADATARGDRLMQEQQYAQAAEGYGTAVAAAPNDGELRLKLSEALQMAGQHMPAASEAVRAADLLPDRLDVQLVAARRLVGTGSYIDGADRIAAVLDREPDNAAALVISGNANARMPDSTRALFLLPAAETLAALEKAQHGFRPPGSFPNDKAAEAAFRKALAIDSDLTEAQLALANFLWVTGRFEESEPLLQRVAEAIPGHVAPNYALGRWYLLRGRGAEAEPYLNNAARVDVFGRGAGLALADHYEQTQRYAEAHALLGTMLADDASGAVALRLAELEYRQGRHDEAMTRLNELLATSAEHAGALRLKAQIWFEAGRVADALPLARTAVAHMPDSPRARSTLGHILLAVGRPDSAFSEYTEAVRLDPHSPEPYVGLTLASLARDRGGDAALFAQDAVRRLPDDREVRLLLVQARIQAKDYAIAEQEVKRLLSQEPDWARAHAQLGAVYVARGNGAAARAAFARALERNPTEFEAVSGVVSLDIEDRRFTQAQKVAERALAARAADPRYMLLAARAYEGAGEGRHAEALLRKVLAADPEHADAMLALASLLSRQARAAEAVRLLQQFAAERPDALGVQIALGALLEQEGRPADAIAVYDRIVARAPEHGTAATRLATLYLDRGESLERGLELALAARERARDDAEINHLIGMLYVRTNAAWQAIPYLQQALVEQPDNARYRYTLGFAYAKNGDVVRANRELRRALELDPSALEAAEARAALRGEIKK